jgi:hypothetical protein
MHFLREFLPIVVTSFVAGVFCGGFFFGHWFLKYDGEKIREVNSSSEMYRLRKIYGLERTKEVFIKWKRLIDNHPRVKNVTRYT